MAAGAAASFGFGKVGSIAVQLEDHIAGCVGNGGIWVRSAIVEEVRHGVNSVLRTSGLRGGEVAEDVQHCRIDGTSVK